MIQLILIYSRNYPVNNFFISLQIILIRNITKCYYTPRNIYKNGTHSIKTETHHNYTNPDQEENQSFKCGY